MRDDMNKKNLRDGMVVKTREGKMYLVLNHKLMNQDAFTLLRLSDYDKNLLYNNPVKDLDIMSVWATKGQTLNDLFDDDKLRLIWKRDTEIDWNKVPVDTPVYVKNDGDKDWTPRFFKGLDDKKFLTWRDGRASFTAESGWLDVTSWEQCRLARQADIEKYRL